MTDTQTVVTAIGGAATLIAAAIRWGSGRLAKAQDRSIAAMIKNAESNATLAARLEFLLVSFDSLVARVDRMMQVLLAGGGGGVVAAAGSAPTGPVGKDPTRPKAKSPRATTANRPDGGDAE